MLDLHALATTLLDKVRLDFALAGVALPARQYVTSGEVAIDCEQLVVEVGELRLDLPDFQEERRLKLPRMMSCDMTVWLVRCVPVTTTTGKPPTAAQLDASAELLLRDRRLCWIAAMSTSWQDVCQDASGGTGQAFGPEGGYGGCWTRVTVQV